MSMYLKGLKRSEKITRIATIKVLRHVTDLPIKSRDKKKNPLIVNRGNPREKRIQIHSPDKALGKNHFGVNPSFGFIRAQYRRFKCVRAKKLARRSIEILHFQEAK